MKNPLFYLLQEDHITDPEGILNEFHSFYSTLYSELSSGSAQSLLDKLGGILLLSLSSEKIESLETPLTVLEIEAAICSFPNNKSLGLDGLAG